MERLAIELVDSGVISISRHGQVSAPNPGLAIIDDGQVLVGHDAAARARLTPRRLHSRFWHHLGTETLARPFPAHLRTADLAHAHLAQIWRTAGASADEVLLAVPGTATLEQLRLLLGIALACDMPVRALVDLAVAAAADRPLSDRCLHLDIHLHRAVLTELDHGSELTRRAVFEESRVGMVPLLDRWARTVARRFVRDTRFDPLLEGVTEQALYSRLPERLATNTSNGSVEFRIPSGDREHTIVIERGDVIDAVAADYAILAEWIAGRVGDDGATLLLSHRAAVLPGLEERLTSVVGAEVAVLHPAAAGSALLDHAPELASPGPGLRFRASLPAFDARPPGAHTVAVDGAIGRTPSGTAPTHVVIDGIAHRLEAEPLVVPRERIGLEADGHVLIFRRTADVVIVEADAGHGLSVNGQEVEGPTELLAGDRLRFGSHEILLVKMAE